MTLFINSTEKDQAVADALKDHLKARGLIVEMELGDRGYRPLGRMDVVVALWSQTSVFSIHRMLFEKRMLEAWADDRLVLIKLDHAFLPVGLRDLPFIDATFVETRALTAWSKVEQAARAVLAHVMAPGEEAAEETPPPARREADDAGAPPSRGRAAPSLSPSLAASQRPARPTRGNALMVGALVAGIALAVGVYIATRELVWAAPAAALVVIVALTLRNSRGSPPAAKSQARSAIAAKSSAATTLAPEPETAQFERAGVFVSYAHADAASVDPVVRIVEASGRTVWIDKGGIQPGEGWAGEIVRGIRGAGGVIVMCSPRAFESDHIKREVYLADRYKKKLLPVFLEAASPPEDFEYFFANVQWLELFKLPQAERTQAITSALARI